MTTRDQGQQGHPLEELEAYALGALDELETGRLETHLAGCFQCGREAGRLQGAAVLLGQVAEPLTPPAALQPRVMRAVVPPAAPPRYAVPPRRPRPRLRAWWAPAARFMAPVAAAVLIGLFSVSVALSVRVSERTGDVERENATLTAEMALSEDRNDTLAEAVRQLQATNYLLANPSSQPVALRSPTGGPGPSQGMLLVANDGRGAAVLLSGMDEESPSSTYQVWLMRDGEKMLAGTVQVDESGWGAATIEPQEPVFGFDTLALAMEPTPGAAPSGADMVLEADLRALRPSQMVSYPRPW